MKLNPYDTQVATAFKASREVPRAGLEEWRAAIERHLRPLPGMTLVDIGAGTGAYAAAFADWFGIDVIAVEPSAAMRSHIPSAIPAHDGDACALPLPDDSADAAWLSLVLHHVLDLERAAQEIRRVLRPGAPVLIRQGFPGRLEGVELVRWFPETARVANSYATIDEMCGAFATAGFRREALEPVRETRPGTATDLLGELDALREADTTLRALTEEEFERGKARIKETGAGEPRDNWL
ncbi:MAG TPA: methyltransferase domain-containing protein, partial [Gaiellaceae bacterium]|nr:methyltransferase domain-containing protein [Gaiellaceae bacterium]